MSCECLSSYPCICIHKSPINNLEERETFTSPLVRYNFGSPLDSGSADQNSGLPTSDKDTDKDTDIDTDLDTGTDTPTETVMDTDCGQGHGHCHGHIQGHGKKHRHRHGYGQGHGRIGDTAMDIDMDNLLFFISRTNKLMQPSLWHITKCAISSQHQ